MNEQHEIGERGVANASWQANLSAKVLTPLQNMTTWNGCRQPAAIHDCIPRKHRARQAVTAMHTIADQLQLFSWRVDANGVVACTGHTEGQGEDIVQIALVAAEKYVAAWRTRLGQLYLQWWDVSNTGAFYRSTPTICAAEALSWFQLLALDARRVLLIGLHRSGNWQFSSWQIHDERAPEQLAIATLPATNGALAATLLPPPTHAVPSSATPSSATPSSATAMFATVMHHAIDTIGWTVWQCGRDGQLEIRQQHTADYAAVLDLAVTTVGDQMVTFLHRMDGHLQTLMQPASAPNEFDLAASQLTPLATDVQRFAVARDANTLAIACTTAAQAQPSRGQLNLLRLAIPESPSVGSAPLVHQIGSMNVTTAPTLALCDQALEGNAPLLMAIGQADGQLRLVTWG